VDKDSECSVVVRKRKRDGAGYLD